jgi:hypothetical protein
MLYNDEEEFESIAGLSGELKHLEDKPLLLVASKKEDVMAIRAFLHAYADSGRQDLQLAGATWKPISSAVLGNLAILEPRSIPVELVGKSEGAKEIPSACLEYEIWFKDIQSYYKNKNIPVPIFIPKP